MNVLLTGSSGFIGKVVLQRLLSNSYGVYQLNRNIPDDKKLQETRLISADLENIDELKDDFFSKIDCVIHLAAVAHNDNKGDGLSINHKMATNIAKQASSNGVKKFIFLSSIGVLGQESEKPFNEFSEPNPYDDYTNSKFETEKELTTLALTSAMDVIILRPPLVYGFKAPGSFGILVKWIRRGFPLPFGAINNKRTFISVENLADIILLCVNHPSTLNQIFLVSDDETVTTTKFLQLTSLAMGKPPNLIAVPQFWIKVLLFLLGKKNLSNKLIGSLQVDNSKVKRILGWKPAVTLEKGLMNCFTDDSKL
jgi:nucleoside-diphosphate-sugar epimerase